MDHRPEGKNFIDEIMESFSIEDILKDFRRSAAPAATAVQEEEDVRVYVPGEKTKNEVKYSGDYLSEEQRRFKAEREREIEEIELMPGLYDFGLEEKRRRRDYSSYRNAPQPSEEEIRAYIDSLTQEDIDRLSAESEPYEPRRFRERPEDFEPEIDSRFNIGKDVYRFNDQMRYDGQELDVSAEPDYVPPSAEGYNPSHWSSGEGEYREEEPAVTKKGRRRRGKKEKDSPAAYVQPRYSAEEEDFARSFRDYNGPEADYAPGGDYSEEYGEQLDQHSDFFPSSFKEYIFSMVTSLLFRFKGGKGVSMTMEEDDEELGQELSPAAASKYYGSFTRSMRLRLRISLAIEVLMLLITLGLGPGMLKSTQGASAACMGMQLCIMLLCLDVFTGGMLNMFQGRAGADSLCALSCIVTSIDALMSALGYATAHMPLCAASSLSLCGLMLSALLSTRGLRKAIRVPAIGKKNYAVTGEMGVRRGEVTLLKSQRPSAGFVRRTEEAAPDETYFGKVFLPSLALAVLLALIVAGAKKSFGEMVFIFSAILTPAAPVAAMLCFALPFFIGSMRIFPSGAAIAGWSGLSDIGTSKNLIVTDRDLFPEGSVELENVRIFADESANRVIAYAGTMVTAAGSAVSGCFGELMVKNGCSMCQVENFEFLAGGGMGGIIDGHRVLCGNSDLMRLMNIRIPSRLVDKNSVLLAIDGILYGIFSIKYTAQPQVRKALQRLMRSNRHPVFAIRDFNITPEMLHRVFDVATDGYDFPPYVERFAISDAQPSEDSKIAAVICREGLGPLTHMADTGRTMYLTVRANIIVTALSAALGMLAVFLKLMGQGFVSPGFILLFMALSTLPVIAMSVLMKS